MAYSRAPPLPVTDNLTKKERTVVSNSDGGYKVSQLEFGVYTVKVTANGFKTFTATEVKIDAGRDYPLRRSLAAQYLQVHNAPFLS